MMSDILQILAVISGFIAILTFGIGVYQYSTAQKWKRAEFVAAQMKDFESSVLVRRAMRMLDFRKGTIQVDTRAIEFNVKILAEALPHEDLKPETSADEAEIRLAFCEFFDGLERMHHFLETGLIDAPLLAPYLPYWYRRFTTTRYKNQEFVNSIWTFIDGYEYEGVRELAVIFKFEPPKQYISPQAAVGE